MSKGRAKSRVIRSEEKIWFDPDLDLEVRMSSLGRFRIYSADFKRSQDIGYIEALKRFRRLVNIAIKEHKEGK